MIIPPRRTNPRTAHRLQQSERVNNSPSLAKQFPALKSLKVTLEYFDTERFRKNGELTYKVNLHHAKSMFSFVCRDPECVGGDFDLSSAVADAVGRRLKIVEGEIQCQGWHNTAKKQKVPCRMLLRYKLNLAYL